MAQRVCPPWLGYFLLNPLRRFFEDPDEILGPLVREGMTVLEPGCGMGYFTLALARMVGPKGRVIAAEIQEPMLSALARRAGKACLLERIDLRLLGKEGRGLEGLEDRVDLVVAIHMVHEVPDQRAFFEGLWRVLRPGGRILLREPGGHVSQPAFERTLETARREGFAAEVLQRKKVHTRERLLEKRGQEPAG